MNRLKLFLLGLIFSVGSFSACDDDDNNSNQTSIGNVIVQGTWRVTLFNENGVDETQNFSGYNFTFNPTGNVVATNGVSTIPGTWTIDEDDNNPDDFLLNFGVVSPFDELNEDWDILENSATKIRLQHVSGGNGGTDLLTFEKN